MTWDPANELQRPSRDPAAARLLAGMTAIHQGHAGAGPGQVSRGHHPGGSCSDDNDLERLH